MMDDNFHHFSSARGDRDTFRYGGTNPSKEQKTYQNYTYKAIVERNGLFCPPFKIAHIIQNKIYPVWSFIIF